MVNSSTSIYAAEIAGRKIRIGTRTETGAARTEIKTVIGVTAARNQGLWLSNKVYI